ncbi:hypothetical protein [Paenibacillus daejeonensis]|uniref:hypothetical protein n=1 Tax=Paenibacillus daejeonensis TaxID=135193 RepID=UPI00037A2E38|nr:hypothetical protein [Paenibacillus daejeonensis]
MAYFDWDLVSNEPVLDYPALSMVRADAATKESLLGALNMMRADAVTKESLLGVLNKV